jgi:hypothetical protein
MRECSRFEPLFFEPIVQIRFRRFVASGDEPLRRAVGEKALDSSHLVDNSLIRSRSRSVKGLRVWITNASGGRVCISSSSARVSQQGGKLTPQVIRDMLYCRQCGLGGHNFPPVSQGSLTHQDRTVRFSYRPLQREER